ncbi:hypothetical protein [Vibrio algicola]|uniref:Transcriptional regulator VspR n=1 Tax=Vibrio algicola TaxID=2662262 RepID=A0A5Q0THB4_9VIBR|nr:hypothetical protein [Vibrio algicola]
MKKEKDFIRKFLIENEMSDFTVRDVVNLLMLKDSSFDVRKKTYQYVYRNVCRLETLGRLRSYGFQRHRRFKKLGALYLKESNFELNGLNTIFQDNPILAELDDEKAKAETDLAIVLGEVDEYKTLISRLPKHKSVLQGLIVQTSDKSARLLGKINALSTVIEYSSTNIDDRGV